MVGTGAYARDWDLLGNFHKVDCQSDEVWTPLPNKL